MAITGKKLFSYMQWWMPYYGYIIKGSNSQMKTLPWYFAFIWFEWEATNKKHKNKK